MGQSPGTSAIKSSPFSAERGIGAKAPKAVVLNKPPQTTKDPEVLQLSSEISKAQLKRRLADDKIPGPGSYEAHIAYKNNGKDFPSVEEYDQKRYMSP